MSLFPYMAIGVASRLMCAALAEARSRLSPFASLFDCHHLLPYLEAS